MPESIHGPGAGAEIAQAVGHRLGGDLPGRAGGLERCVPEGQAGSERRGMGAAGAVGRAARVPRALDQLEVGAVEEAVGAVLGVPAGDDGCGRPKGNDRTGELLGRGILERRSVRAPRPGSG